MRSLESQLMAAASRSQSLSAALPSQAAAGGKGAPPPGGAQQSKQLADVQAQVRNGFTDIGQSQGQDNCLCQRRFQTARRCCFTCVLLVWQ